MTCRFFKHTLPVNRISVLNVAQVFAGNVVISIQGVVNGSVYTGGKGIDTSLFYDTASPEYREWTKIIGMKNSGELGYIPWFVGNEDKVHFKKDPGTYDSFASSSSTSTAAFRSVEMTDGTIGGSVYGGGAIGITDIGAGKISVAVNSGTVSGSIYGGGMGLEGDTEAGRVQAGKIDVTIGTTTTEPTIKGSVYGGGAYSFTVSEIAVVINNGNMYGNVFSGGLGTINIQSTAGKRTLNMIGGRVKGSIYGSSSYGNDGSGDYPHDTEVEISAGIVDGSVYGAGFKGITHGKGSLRN